MHKLLLALAILAVVLVPAGGAGAGSEGSESVLTVVKVVEGPAPADAAFTVRVTCPEGSPSTPIDLDFTATGGTQTTMIPGIFPQVCSVAETVTGGADPVAYQCDVVEAGGATNIPAECLSSTEFQTGVDGEITVTVTNTFPDEIPPDPAAPPPAAAAPAVAPAVAGTPTFTG